VEPWHLGEVVTMRSRVNKSAFLIPALLVLQLSAAAIDLTPRYIDTFIDGIVSRRLYFSDGEKKIGISLDHETTVEPGGGGVIFRFTKVPDASFLIKSSPMTPDQPFEGIALDRYREAARRLLPPGAKEVKALDEVDNTLPINRWTSRRFSYTFESGDTVMAMSITFLNLNKEDQLILVTSSTEKNFNEASERSFQIIRTWQPLMPKDEKLIKSS
jgi:hypothetical protein